MKKYMINSSGDLMFADDDKQESIILPKGKDNLEVEHTDVTDPDMDVNIDFLMFHKELVRRLTIIQQII